MVKIDKTEEREIPVIPITSFKWNAEHFEWREARINLPAGLVAQDLQDAQDTIWRIIQNNAATGLHKFDRVFIIAHDETWAAEARVGHADKNRVVLANITIIKLPVVDLGLYDDGTYRVIPFPGGYIVQRNSDAVRMSNATFDNPEAAKAELLRLYPTKAA